jgi:hypothetical protein
MAQRLLEQARRVRVGRDQRPATQRAGKRPRLSLCLRSGRELDREQLCVGAAF